MKSFLISFFALLLILSGCSVKQNTPISRAYHQLLTRYNVYFNGSQAFDKSLRDLEKGYVDDYSRLVPLHPIDELAKKGQTTTFQRPIEKAQKCIQMHSIQTPPKSGKYADSRYRAEVKIEEYNMFLDRAWMMLAQGRFYNGDMLGAASTFAYVEAHFRNLPLRVTEARLWRVYSYLEMGWINDAEVILQKVDPDALQQQSAWLRHMVLTNYHLRTGNKTEAMKFLAGLIVAERNKLQKARQYFLLGQLAESSGDRALALSSFANVVKLNPPYGLSFTAQIKQTEFLTGVESNKALKRLRSMAKRGANKDYLDQIYYAIGNIYLAQKDTVEAIRAYTEGIAKSEKKGVEQAVIEARLGGLYFHQRRYKEAQPCYVGAVAKFSKEDERYADLERIGSVLDELVDNSQKVELQDSLIRLAGLSESEQMKVAVALIERLKKEAEEKAKQEELDKRMAEREAMMGDQRADQKQLQAPTSISSDKSWYFYNQQTVSRGKADFQSKWGARKLEDNWRRRNKTQFNYEELRTEDQAQLTGDGENMTNQRSDSLGTAAVNDPMMPEYYLAQIPKTPEQIATAEEIIKEGLFNIAEIFRDKLQDYPMAISTYEELIRRFPVNDYLLLSYYGMYTIGERMSNVPLSTANRDRIIAQFPESKEAKILSDPNYFANYLSKSTEQSDLYTVTYEAYRRNDYQKVIDNLIINKERYPAADLNAKFHFIGALAYMAQGNNDSFRAELQTLVDSYPNDEAAPIAGSMLKGLSQGRAVASDAATFGDGIWAQRIESKEEGAGAGEVSFVVDPDVAHLILFAFPNDGVNRDRLLYDIAAFQFRNYKVKDFSMDFLTLENISMLRISPFVNYDELLIYRKFLASPEGIGDKLPASVRTILISEDNFRILLGGKTFAEYFDFYQKNFSDK